MAKTSAPLLGFGASGTIADTLVYATWRGVPYARRHVIPGNPNTVPQQQTRNMFRTLSQMWKQLPAGAIAPWNAFATGRPFLGVNAFTGQNVRAMRSPTTQTDMELFIGSPGARGGPAPSDLVLTPGATTMDAAMTIPTPPVGWTITEMQGIIFPDQDPTLDFAGPIQYAFDASSTYELNFTGLDGTTDYIVCAWLEYERPDGQPAYSISLTDLGVTS